MPRNKLLEARKDALVVLERGLDEVIRSYELAVLCHARNPMLGFGANLASNVRVPALCAEPMVASQRHRCRLRIVEADRAYEGLVIHRWGDALKDLCLARFGLFGGVTA